MDLSHSKQVLKATKWAFTNYYESESGQFRTLYVCKHETAQSDGSKSVCKAQFSRGKQLIAHLTRHLSN